MQNDVTEKTSSPTAFRWVVLASSFLCLFLTGFSEYHAGVMKIALIDHLGYDVTMATWLVSYYAAMFALSAPVGSLLINLFGCRTCVTLSGFFCLLGFALCSLATNPTYLLCTLTLAGVGQGLCNSGSLVVLYYHFPDQLSIVTGVSISGGALGIFVHPPLLQALVDRYTLQGAFLLLGAITFQGTVFGALLRPSRLEIQTQSSNRRGAVVKTFCASPWSLWTGHLRDIVTCPMLFLVICVCMNSIAFHSLIVLMPGYLHDEGGLTSTEASFALSVLGIGSFCSRLLAGMMAQDPRVGSDLVMCGLLGVQSLVCFTAPSLIASGLIGSYVYCFMVGLYSGGCFMLISPLIQLIVRLKDVSTAFGIALFALGVGCLLGAPLTEFVKSFSTNPYVLFGFLGFLFALAAFFGCMITALPSSIAPKGTHTESSPDTSAHEVICIEDPTTALEGTTLSPDGLGPETIYLDSRQESLLETIAPEEDSLLSHDRY